MTTSQTTHAHSPTSADEAPIAPAVLGYFNAYAQDQAYDAVMRLFLELADRGEINRATIARRLNKAPEQVTRWLGAPGNWTLKTLADLLISMDYVPQISAIPRAELRPGNYCHPATYYFETEQQPSAPPRAIATTGSDYFTLAPTGALR